jgi:hypothetical protein
MSSEWTKCTLNSGEPIFVNLATAAYIRVVESETRIIFPGASDDYIRVTETPAEILSHRVLEPA